MAPAAGRRRGLTRARHGAQTGTMFRPTPWTTPAAGDGRTRVRMPSGHDCPDCSGTATAPLP
ncbi:hypothetical protein DIZ27_40535 [Streptomyces sp. NWU339]|nr:hypothetical protein DIZ27_40535 [Streptomyces sp. NWU339]